MEDPSHLGSGRFQRLEHGKIRSLFPEGKILMTYIAKRYSCDVFVCILLITPVFTVNIITRLRIFEDVTQGNDATWLTLARFLPDKRSISCSDITVMGIIPALYLYPILQNIFNFVDLRVRTKGPILSFSLFHIATPMYDFSSLL